MDTSRILVIGKGHLGSFLAERWNLPDAMHWKKEMELLTPVRLRDLAPVAVVNGAGKTDLRWCEDNPAETFRCNVTAPLNVFRSVQAAFAGKVPFIQISSGCLWDGPYHPSGRPFRPDDPVTPACYYAWTKAACDALLLREPASRLAILRPRQLFSHLPSPRNTLVKLSGYPRLLDTPNSMTSANTLARTVEIVLQRAPIAWGRIINVYDAGVTSPYQIGMLQAEAGLRKKPEKLAKSDLDAWHKPKRVDAVIEDPFFEALVGPPNVLDQTRLALAAPALSECRAL